MSLAAQLELHRGIYRDELGRVTRLTVAHVPADTEPIPLKEGMVEVTDSGELGGMPFSTAMVRRLGPPQGYGAMYPWAHSWSYLRRACRNDHPGHTARPEFGGALCWQVVSWAVVSEFTPQTIAGILRLPIEDVERHLRRAFAWIEEDMDRKQRIRNARDPQPSEEPSPTRLTLLQCDAVNRAVADFDLEQRIWEAQVGVMRRRLSDDDSGLWDRIEEPKPHYVKLTPEQWEERWSWEREWQRRQEALWSHRQECDRCRRAA
jgi:hypothetical protein